MLGTVDVVELDPKPPNADLDASAGFDALPLAAGAPKLKPGFFSSAVGVAGAAPKLNGVEAGLGASSFFSAAVDAAA